MLAIRKTAAKAGISLQSVPLPHPPQSGEVTVQVHSAGICGSDLQAYLWTESYYFMTPHLPLTLGHEFAGMVIEVPAGDHRLKVGDKVAVMPTSYCMRCRSCLVGDMHLCAQTQTLGLTKDGAFSKFVNVPESSCIVLDPGIDLALAALIEPLSVGDNIVAVGEVGFSDTVVVLGPGTIGQAAIYAAYMRGCRNIIAVGLDDQTRLKVAQSLGANILIDLAADNVKSLQKRVEELTSGAPIDVVIEATGHPSSIKDGIALLKKGGVLVTAGIHKAPANIDLTEFVRKKLQLRAAHGSQRKAWEVIARQIAQNPESVRPMVSMQMSLRDAELGFQKSLDGSVSKVILHPDE